MAGRTTLIRLLCSALAVVATMSCSGGGAQHTLAAPETAALALPAPNLDGTASLELVLSLRRSVREFTAEPLRRDQIGQLLWAGQGITGPGDLRTAPSAGARYPLDLYTVGANEVLHYVPHGHRADVRASRDLRPDLADAALGQDAVRDAPTVVVIAASPSRTASRYGARTDDYVRLEAGHVAQNILLEATAIGLGAVPIGAFDRNRVRDLLALARDQVVIYLIPVGHPR